MTAAAAAIALAFFAACGDLETFHGRLVGREAALMAAVIPMERVEPTPPGSPFTLGQELGTAGSGDVTPLTSVELTQGFYMGRYPVTREQWITVMEGNPNGIPVPHPGWWIYASANDEEIGEGFDINRRPATHVSWYDAIVFANRQSIARGLRPAYEIQCASNGGWTTNPARWGAVPTSSDARWNAVRIAGGSNGYRLPTEAQWEWAAKGGDSGDAFTFSGSDIVGAVAWHWTLNGADSGHSGNSPRMVGLLLANGLGIYDMSGNVFEWVWDWYAVYPGGLEIDWTGAPLGTNRVLRGGSFGFPYGSARSVVRSQSNPSNRMGVSYGFRLVRP